MDAGLQKIVFKIINDLRDEDERYEKSKGRLIRLPMSARIKPVVDYTAQAVKDANLDLLKRLEEQTIESAGYYVPNSADDKYITGDVIPVKAITRERKRIEERNYERPTDD